MNKQHSPEPAPEKTTQASLDDNLQPHDHEQLKGLGFDVQPDENEDDTFDDPILRIINLPHFSRREQNTQASPSSVTSLV
jgi:hypothetical protein